METKRYSGELHSVKRDLKSFPLFKVHTIEESLIDKSIIFCAR
jgi:hypothetical protein